MLAVLTSSDVYSHIAIATPLRATATATSITITAARTISTTAGTVTTGTSSAHLDTITAANACRSSFYACICKQKTNEKSRLETTVS